jgi:hypothetical protein
MTGCWCWAAGRHASLVCQIRTVVLETCASWVQRSAQPSLDFDVDLYILT